MVHVNNTLQGFFQGGAGGAFASSWLWLAPLEIFFHMSGGKVLILWMMLRIKHSIASGGLRPQTPCFRDVASLYSNSLFQDPTIYLKTECRYKMCAVGTMKL